MNGTKVDKLEDAVIEQNLIKISSDIVNVLIWLQIRDVHAHYYHAVLYNTMFGVYMKGPHYKPIVL